MSIYATLWVLKFPSHGDFHSQCDWVTVVGQGVPAHIGTPSHGHGYECGDPYDHFLPPAVPMPESDDGTSLRAVVIVRAGTEKIGQEYVSPLLILSGKDYRGMSFDDLQRRICERLRENQPRLIAEVLDERGSRLVFEDRSTKDASRVERQELPFENE